MSGSSRDRASRDLRTGSLDRRVPPTPRRNRFAFTTRRAALTASLLAVLSAAGASASQAAPAPGDLVAGSTSLLPAVSLPSTARTVAGRSSPIRAVASGRCPGANLMPTPSNLGRIQAATLCLINVQRALAGEAPLRNVAKLDRAAQAHSADMTARDYFDHVSPDAGSLVSRLFAAGYLRRGMTFSVGENIAWGTSGYATPASTVASWMQSPGHRANILRAQFRGSGIGVSPAVPDRSLARQQGATYTEDFGARA